VGVRLKATLLAGMAIAAVAIGCGGGDSTSESASGGSESDSGDRSAFIKEATAACAKARGGTLKKVAAYQQEHRSDGQSPAVLAKEAVYAALRSTIAAEIAALEAVEVPEADEEEFEAILAAIRSDLKEAKEGKNKAYDEFEDYFSANSDKQLRAFGLPECTKQG
jgi:hypothetical protein